MQVSTAFPNASSVSATVFSLWCLWPASSVTRIDLSPTVLST